MKRGFASRLSTPPTRSRSRRVEVTLVDSCEGKLRERNTVSFLLAITVNPQQRKTFHGERTQNKTEAHKLNLRGNRQRIKTRQASVCFPPSPHSETIVFTEWRFYTLAVGATSFNFRGKTSSGETVYQRGSALFTQREGKEDINQRGSTLFTQREGKEGIDQRGSTHYTQREGKEARGSNPMTILIAPETGRRCQWERRLSCVVRVGQSHGDSPLPQMSLQSERVKTRCVCGGMLRMLSGTLRGK